MTGHKYGLMILLCKVSSRSTAEGGVREEEVDTWEGVGYARNIFLLPPFNHLAKFSAEEYP